MDDPTIDSLGAPRRAHFLAWVVTRALAIYIVRRGVPDSVGSIAPGLHFRSNFRYGVPRFALSAQGPTVGASTDVVVDVGLFETLFENSADSEKGAVFRPAFDWDRGIGHRTPPTC